MLGWRGARPLDAQLLACFTGEALRYRPSAFATISRLRCWVGQLAFLVELLIVILVVISVIRRPAIYRRGLAPPAIQRLTRSRHRASSSASPPRSLRRLATHHAGPTRNVTP